MNTKEIISQAARGIGQKKRRFQASDVTTVLKESVSRQYITSTLKELVSKGELLREGGGRYTFYALPQNAEYLGKRIRRRLVNSDLKEHEVLNDIEKHAPFLSKMPENVRSIFTYAFSEMLNNAIEHSESKQIQVDVNAVDGKLSFTVRDEGVGAFRNVMAKQHLRSELEAIQELLKGKTTTAPHAHSGEGIFFTSKIAGVFSIDSFGYRLRVDNHIKDVFIEVLPESVKGTKVEFELKLDTKEHLNDVFTYFQTDPSGFAFDKTEILVKLYAMGSIYISRSQARRVMSGLGTKFKVVTLDFDKVPTVGQAFADEVFRVFKNKHPEVTVSTINMNEAVAFMVGRVAQE